jgi:3-methyladenine DNA glycosylase Mpg
MHGPSGRIVETEAYLGVTDAAVPPIAQSDAPHACSGSGTYVY